MPEQGKAPQARGGIATSGRMRQLDGRFGLPAFSDGIGVVQGRTQAQPGAEGYGEHFSRPMEAREEDGHYPTCNIFYRREALERAGGFDETFRRACGEDTDLAWRVKALD